MQALPLGAEACWSEPSLEKYQEWLQQANAWSRLRFLSKDQAPLWIESWSGHQRWWKPQQGDSLKAVPATNPSAQRRNWGECHSSHQALILHGFYLDKFDS